METIVKLELPLKRLESLKKGEFGYDSIPWWKRWGMRIYQHRRCSIGEFGGTRTNTTHHFIIFGWPVLSVARNEYHDESDKERADHYLTEWSRCEKELRGLRLLQLGDEVPDPELRKLFRDGFGVDLDEGRLL